MKLGLIVLDTLRQDVGESELTSVFDMADHRFETLYSTSRWTVPAHASLFTGLYPTEVDTHAHERYLTTPEPTIAERLDQAGYNTIALSNNVHIDTYFQFARGFGDLYRGPALEGRPDETATDFDWDELFSTIGDGPLRYPRAISRVVQSDAATLPTLKAGFELFWSSTQKDTTNDILWAFDAMEDSRPDNVDDLFLFANLMPCHFPYEPPDGYAPVEPLDTPPFELTLRDDPVTDEEHTRYWENYVGAARYLDDDLPKLLDWVDWDCLFVISDHGELFGEHGFYGHEYGITDHLVRVPGVALGNEVPAGVTDSPTSILDIHRTLLELADQEVPEHVRGVNLFEDDIPADRTVYAESTGVGQYSPDAKGILANIPKEWNREHYMGRTSDAMLVHDFRGSEVFDPDTRDVLADDETQIQQAVEEIRNDRHDFAGDGDMEVDGVPDDVQDRLEHLGYA